MTGFEPGLTGWKTAIATSEPQRPKGIWAKNIVITFFP